MAPPLKILYVASEVTPFAKTGGLADVASALPKEIKESGHDIRIFMPKHASVNNKKFVLRDVIRLQGLQINYGDHVETVDVRSSFLPNSKVQVYFLEYAPYFDRKELYVDPETGTDFKDNAERYSMFCRVALEMLKQLYWQPDIIHCNDWQTGLIPVFLKTLYVNDNFFKKTKTIFTIHNMAYQGNFFPDKLKKTGLPQELFYSGSSLELYGKLSFLKAGIEYSDILNTVSPTYAQEIQKSGEFGCGLEKTLKKRSEDIFGILNGVDYSEWSPGIDKYIPFNYDFKSIAKKQKNKKHLLNSCNLPYNPAQPCIGTISRFVDQKGFDLIIEVIDKLMKLNFLYIILGKGEAKYQNYFKKIQKKYPDKIRVFLQFDNDFAHRMEAGCDMFLMPSRYEPCGLNQLYSLRYGTIPIVRTTGGLADTVVDFTTNPDSGTGFMFKEYNSEDMYKTIEKAIQTFADKKKWLRIAGNAMKKNFSWSNSAHEYIKLYTKVVRSK